jgi:hypothetical protein
MQELFRDVFTSPHHPQESRNGIPVYKILGEQGLIPPLVFFLPREQ